MPLEMRLRYGANPRFSYVCERQGLHTKYVIFLSKVLCLKSSNPIVGMDYANKVATYVLSASSCPDAYKDWIK